MITSEAVRQALLLVAQASFLATTLLVLFRLLDRIGITPLYLAVGSLQYLQVVLALSIYVEIAPGINVSPGSAVLFPATLFTVLLVYIRLGVAKTRLLGSHGPVPQSRGEWTELIHDGETVGAVLRTRAGVKPVYVSTGHRVSLESAVSLVMRCVTRYRLPETTRQADRLASNR